MLNILQYLTVPSHLYKKQRRFALFSNNIILAIKYKSKNAKFFNILCNKFVIKNVPHIKI